MSTEPRNQSVRQEPDRIRTLAVTLTLLAATAIAAGGVFWSWLELRADRARPAARVARFERVPQTPPSVGGVRQTLIEADPTTASRIAQQRERLESYGWVNRTEGIVRIPIERAMQVVVEREAR